MLACTASRAEDPVVSDSDDRTGGNLAARHAIIYTAPAGRVPTNFMVDGPLLGNGDVGVVVAGPPELLNFYIGKNDFWARRTQSLLPVGQIQIRIPRLQGASYRAIGNMELAYWQGTFNRGAAGLITRAWVDANGNRFFAEFLNSGTTPLVLSINQIKGTEMKMVPAQILDNARSLIAGCEQHGGSRWFFKGEMSGIKVENRSLTSPEIQTLAKGTRGEIFTFDGKSLRPLIAPAVHKELSISGWVKVEDVSGDANYIISKGEWNESYSLGLANGYLRFAVNGTLLQLEDPLPRGIWIHLAAVFNGSQMALYLNGELKVQLGNDQGKGGLSFLNAPDGDSSNVRRVAVATSILNSGDTNVTNQTINLSPGSKVVIASVVLSDLDAKDPLIEAKNQLAALSIQKVNDLALQHQRYWKNFWNQSFIEIPDKVIEQQWYAAQYIMASCSRAGKVAPGLWGNWITTADPAWHGDYHLNYNFEAPFYGVYSANHASLSQPFYDAMNQSIPRGQMIAQAHGWKGIHLPVSIGPWGMDPEGDNCDWGQRSNAAFAALLFGWRYQYTQDKEWLQIVGYPYMREVAAFWTDYLKFENGRYVIHDDSILENSGPDTNGLLSLGLVRALFKNMLVMSKDLGLDADLRPKWQDISNKISDWPLQERDGKTVFRYSESGRAWNDGNSLGIQHIFPAGAIGLDSDPKLLEISRQMISAMNCWEDDNGSSSFYTACARVGYPPDKILGELRTMYDHHLLPNKLLDFGGGGIENVSASLAINEMVLQSHEGVLRFFPCWPKNQNARFGTLRAVGAFLVSAEISDNRIGGVKIQSEKAKDCSVVNPWPGHKVQLIRDGKPAESLEGERFTFKTTSGEAIALNPLN